MCLHCLACFKFLDSLNRIAFPAKVRRVFLRLRLDNCRFAPLELIVAWTHRCRIGFLEADFPLHVIKFFQQLLIAEQPTQMQRYCTVQRRRIVVGLPAFSLEHLFVEGMRLLIRLPQALVMNIYCVSVPPGRLLLGFRSLCAFLWRVWWRKERFYRHAHSWCAWYNWLYRQNFNCVIWLVAAAYILVPLQFSS